jgi:hypothetical protein
LIERHHALRRVVACWSKPQPHQRGHGHATSTTT